MVLLVEQKQAYRTLDCIAHAVLYACYKHKSEKTRAYKLSFMRGGGGCAAGFAKVLPFTRVNFAHFVTLYRLNMLSS